MPSVSIKQFKKKHLKKKNQVIYISEKSNNDFHINNLINNFLNQSNSFVFESVEKARIKGRYTIFGKDPDKIWEFNNNSCYLYKDNKRKKIKGSPQKNIENIVENFKFDFPKELPALSSILAGFFSYDIIRYSENIPNNCVNDILIPDVRILRPRTLVIHDNLKKKIYYLINCFKDEKISNYENKYKEIKKKLEELIFLSNLNLLNKEEFKNHKSEISVKSNISKKKFIQNVLKAKEYIKSGDIFQVVLSQRFETKLSKKPLDIYKKLRLINPSPFMFYFNFNDFQIIGASPEILVRLRDQKITVRPIAGTRPRGKTSKQDKLYEEDLLKDKKELSEHLMLLDLGRNDAGKVAKVNTVKVTESFIIEKYSHVMHIVSNVQGDYNSKFSKFETLLAGFPAGTVSGAPKIRAMEIIDELEKNQRKIYAGGIGYFSANGEFDTCIALRTAVVKNNKFYVQAGAGIVADSIPEKEYQETVNKAKALINAIK